MKTEDNDSEVPLSYGDAISRPDAKKSKRALMKECNTLETHGTRNLIKLSPGLKIIKTKWVFDIKQNGYGDIKQYKAILVAKRYFQIPGIDFTEAFCLLSDIPRYDFCLPCLCSLEEDACLQMSKMHL